MQIGSTLYLTGHLILFGASLRLQSDQGETWRLKAPPSAYKLCGRPVRLSGARLGADELDVDWIDAAS